MKKFLLRIGLFGIICLLLIGGLTGYALSERPNRSAYMYAHKLKMNMLDSIASPRVVLVSGSSVAFGFSARELSRQLGMNVVNAGTSSCIGLRFMLDDISRRLRPGDVVVIAPEYEHFDGVYEGENEALTSAVIYSGSGALKSLDMRQWLVFLSGVPAHLRLNHATPTAGGYNAGNFNELGDEVAHLTKPAVRDLPRGVLFSGKPDRTALADLRSKISDMEQRGCKVVFLWPSCIESYYKANAANLQRLNEAFGEFGIEPAVGADYFVQPDSMVYDTPYHLNAAGIASNTHRLARLLR